MERLRERLSAAGNVLSRLDEVKTLRLPSMAERDAATMRFIYTFEAVWRAVKRYLAVVEGIDVGTPKACIRGARDAGLVSDEQTERALAMVDDRNLAVQHYNENVAEQLARRLPGHIAIIRSLLDAMTERVKDR